MSMNGRMKYQIWLGTNGAYVMISGKACDEPILARLGERVHEFYARSREEAEHIKLRFINHHKMRDR